MQMFGEGMKKSISDYFQHLPDYFGMESFTGMKWQNLSSVILLINPMAAFGSDQFKTRF